MMKAGFDRLMDGRMMAEHRFHQSVILSGNHRSAMPR